MRASDKSNKSQSEHLSKLKVSDRMKSCFFQTFMVTKILFSNVAPNDAHVTKLHKPIP